MPVEAGVKVQVHWLRDRGLCATSCMPRCGRAPACLLDGCSQISWDRTEVGSTGTKYVRGPAFEVSEMSLYDDAWLG